MRKWSPSVMAAIAVLGEVGLGAIAAAQNAQLIGVLINPRYLRPDYLLGAFGVGLLLVYFAARATYPSPAAIRLKYTILDHLRPFKMINIGGTEANSVKISDIRMDGYPWQVEFEEVGSIAAGSEPELPAATIKRVVVGSIPCKDCLDCGEPSDFGQFVIGVINHVAHSIRERMPSADNPDGQWFIWKCAGLTVRASVSVEVGFFDGRIGEIAHHRLDVAAKYTNKGYLEGICLPQSGRDWVAGGDWILEHGLESLKSGAALLMASLDDAGQDGLSRGAGVGAVTA